MLFATASQAALERSSSGRMMTWLRTPTRPFSRRQPQNVALPFFLATDLPVLPFLLDFFAIVISPSRVPGERSETRDPGYISKKAGSRLVLAALAWPGHEKTVTTAWS